MRFGTVVLFLIIGASAAVLTQGHPHLGCTARVQQLATTFAEESVSRQQELTVVDVIRTLIARNASAVPTEVSASQLAAARTLLSQLTTTTATENIDNNNSNNDDESDEDESSSMIDAASLATTGGRRRVKQLLDVLEAQIRADGHRSFVDLKKQRAACENICNTREAHLQSALAAAHKQRIHWSHRRHTLRQKLHVHIGAAKGKSKMWTLGHHHKLSKSQAKAVTVMVKKLGKIREGKASRRNMQELMDVSLSICQNEQQTAAMKEALKIAAKHAEAADRVKTTLESLLDVDMGTTTTKDWNAVVAHDRKKLKFANRKFHAARSAEVRARRHLNNVYRRCSRLPAPPHYNKSSHKYSRNINSHVKGRVAMSKSAIVHHRCMLRCEKRAAAMTKYDVAAARHDVANCKATTTTTTTTPDQCSFKKFLQKRKRSVDCHKTCDIKLSMRKLTKQRREELKKEVEDAKKAHRYTKVALTPRPAISGPGVSNVDEDDDDE